MTQKMVCYKEELEKLAENEYDRDLLHFHRFVGFTDEYIYTTIQQMRRCNSEKHRDKFYPDEDNAIFHINDPYLSWSIMTVIYEFENMIGRLRQQNITSQNVKQKCETTQKMEECKTSQNIEECETSQSEFMREMACFTEEAKREYVEGCKHLELTADTYIAGVVYYFIYKAYKYYHDNVGGVYGKESEPSLGKYSGKISIVEIDGFGFPVFGFGFTVFASSLKLYPIDVLAYSSDSVRIINGLDNKPYAYVFDKLNEIDMLRWLASVLHSTGNCGALDFYFKRIEKTKNVKIRYEILKKRAVIK